MLNVALVGMGRMGKEIAGCIKTSYTSNVQIVSCIDLQGGSYEGLAITPNTDLESAIKGADVAINFTTPTSETELSERIAKCGVDLVIGTTGLSEIDWARVQDAIEKNDISAVIASNFSILVNLQFALAKKTGETLKSLNYDFAVFEEHHTGKLDSPSGTARSIAEVLIATGAAQKMNFRGEGKKKHEPGEIDMAISRNGGMPATHELRVGGQHGLLNISTLMYSRKEFAVGAIESALWLKANRKQGHIFGMGDLLKM